MTLDIKDGSSSKLKGISIYKNIYILPNIHEYINTFNVKRLRECYFCKLQHVISKNFREHAIILFKIKTLKFSLDFFTPSSFTLLSLLSCCPHSFTHSQMKSRRDLQER